MKQFSTFSIIVTTLVMGLSTGYAQSNRSYHKNHDAKEVVTTRNKRIHQEIKEDYSHHNTRNKNKKHDKTCNTDNQREQNRRFENGSVHTHYNTNSAWTDRHYHNQNHQFGHSQLPSNHYFRFYVNDIPYYQCNNAFYRYHPQYGYLRVDPPMSYVNHLPKHTMMVRINNHNYQYHSGNYYIPCQQGYMIVPEKNNHLLFSIKF